MIQNTTGKTTMTYDEKYYHICPNAGCHAKIAKPTTFHTKTNFHLNRHLKRCNHSSTIERQYYATHGVWPTLRKLQQLQNPTQLLPVPSD
jgi:hypothetical protein